MSDKLPQSEGADWFLVLDEGGAIEFAYTADFGRSFGHEHINDAMQDPQLRHQAKKWVVRPAYSQSTVDLLRARIAELERALAECEHQTHSLRVWNGGEYAYHPPQAKRIAKIARAAIEEATKP